MKKKTEKALKIGAIVLGAVLVVGSIVAITRETGDEKTLNRWTNFEVAAVDDKGDYDKDAETNIVSVLVEVDGLKVELDNEDLSFEVHYYDKDEEYISSTSALTEYDATDGETVIPDGAKYARVEITHADDDEITFGERLDYLKDVTVTIAKK